MINWLLGLLPTPVRGVLFLIGAGAYVVSLLNPNSSLGTVCGIIATLSGAGGILGEARAAMQTGRSVMALSDAPGSAKDAPGTPQPVEVGVYQGDGPGVAQRGPQEAGYDPFNPG